MVVTQDPLRGGGGRGHRPVFFFLPTQRANFFFSSSVRLPGAVTDLGVEIQVAAATLVTVPRRNMYKSAFDGDAS